MPFSKCRDVLDRVSEIIDGEAGAVARMRFFGHLAMCEECTRYFEQFKAIRTAAGTVEPEDVPSDFGSVMDTVLSRLDDDPDRSNSS